MCGALRPAHAQGLSLGPNAEPGVGTAGQSLVRICMPHLCMARRQDLTSLAQEIIKCGSHSAVECMPRGRKLAGSNPGSGILFTEACVQAGAYYRPRQVPRSFLPTLTLTLRGGQSTQP